MEHWGVNTRHTLHRNTPPADESCRAKRRKRVCKLKSHDSASMQVEDCALQGLGEHVGMILFGVLVFHNDFPFAPPTRVFSSSGARCVPRSGRKTLSTLGVALDRAHVIYGDPQHSLGSLMSKPISREQ